MLEICEFKPEEIDDAISGMDGLQQIIVPMLRKANYQGMADQDIQQFLRHITLAKHALLAMGDFLEGQMKTPKENPLTFDELREMNGEPVYLVIKDINGFEPPLTMWALIECADDDMGIWLTNSLGGRSHYENSLDDGILAYRRKPEEAST